MSGEYCTHCEWVYKQVIVPSDNVQILIAHYEPECLCQGCAYATSYEAKEEGTYSDFTWTKECHTHRSLSVSKLNCDK